MRLIQTRFLPLLLLSVAVLTLAGCGGGKEFTDADFKKVKKGMTEDQVKEILGSPFDEAEVKDIKRKWWKVGEKYYSASFKDGKVEEPMGPSEEKEYLVMKALMEKLKSMP